MKQLFFLLFLTSLPALSQTQIQGIIFDGKTNNLLPFATITTSRNFGTLTDVDGNFYIKSEKQLRKSAFPMSATNL